MSLFDKSIETHNAWENKEVKIREKNESSTNTFTHKIRTLHVNITL